MRFVADKQYFFFEEKTRGQLALPRVFIVWLAPDSPSLGRGDLWSPAHREGTDFSSVGVGASTTRGRVAVEVVRFGLSDYSSTADAVPLP